MEDQLYQKAIKSVNEGKLAFCKFLSDNDTGKTGTHQCGIYVPKPAKKILFDVPGEKGDNKKRLVKIKWQDDFETESSFTYYGKGTRNEYRITRFGHGFDLLAPENEGSLFVFVQKDNEDYEGFVLNTEDEMNGFLDYFGMTPADTGRLIGDYPPARKELIQAMDSFVDSLQGGFPTGRVMSETARELYNRVYDHVQNIILKPDSELLAWNATEYTLFRRIEEVQFGQRIRQGFPSMKEFVDTANSILNRRKSRAGKSLEYHLEEIFRKNALPFETQVITEERKKPDFVFPSGSAYHNASYPSNKLIVLGAKTTCKDRWRQVVTEANRVETKYLCTMQQGISAQQLHEMQSERIVLVVPKEYIRTYPKEYQPLIWDLKKFIAFVHETME
jgi:hypothetical protein